MELSKKYDHRSVEEGKYEWWRKKGFFASGDEAKKPYTIVIPPPNVTGRLHLGHAWDNTLQDIIIRKKRMEGYDALYLPGMDHAGIATQAKVDELLRERGIDRFELGRKKFLEEAWKWKEEYAAFIREQWAALGISLDYSKERFTLDEGLSHAVKEVFFRLYEKGLVYRKESIINWDVEAKTALSNIEVEHEEVEGAFYYFRYYLKDKSDYIRIATTRPETMFGDTAVMIHPEDAKRQHFLGKKVLIPGTDVAIPVIPDPYVDTEFGTGAVKVTPAHDPNDFEVGERHGLDMPLCMDEDGTMNKKAFRYEGMDRFACRKALVADLKDKGLLDKVETIRHSVGHSERTGVVVEPRLSQQWFVKMKPLAKQALAKSSARFIPPRFEKVFRRWMEDIQDWCISRQLWWGHRIPAHYGPNGEVYVGDNPPEGYKQDEDVLDTWFSSALWPFSTLGWPEETEDFQRYYPTQTMVTGYDIIFFWVARMIFQGLEFTNETPFEKVLIHGLIRDEKGRKMSKSLGNGVDPMDVRDEYGMDTLRYFLSTNSAPGQDLRFEFEKVASSWNYINKLWNISRFVLMHLKTMAEEDLTTDKEELSLPDRWVLSRLQSVIAEVDKNYEKFEFGEVARTLYNFSWEEVASWYVEMSKPILYSDDEKKKKTTKAILHEVLLNIMKMLHPFMPFVTEEIYQNLPVKEAASIMVAPWPKPDKTRLDKEAVESFGIVKSIITRVRNVRSEYDVPAKQPIDIHIACNKRAERIILDNKRLIRSFVTPDTFAVGQDQKPKTKARSFVDVEFTLHVPLGDLFDIEAEIRKQKAEKKRLESEVARAKKMLANEGFLAKAPEKKVKEEKRKLERYRKQLEQVKKRIEDLS